jgi:LSD1 subclass zinc finger protein
MRRLVPSIILIISVLVAGICLVDVSAQKQKRRPVIRRTTTPPARIDYSRFSHTTKKHQGGCNTCHKVPTENWKKVSDFPDVADYPGHDACVSCHRPQFFKGAKPVICSICHSKVSPRDDARLEFRNPAAPRQFLIKFPHDKHQDVIARLFQPGVKQTVSLRSGRHSSFISAKTFLSPGMRDWAHPRVAFAQPQTNSLRYNNCEICHATRTTLLVAPPPGWPDAFVPEAGTFKTAPANHAACFNCHWKAQQPISENCAGCHKLSDQSFLMVQAPKRFSLKFRHQREQHVQECTTCHINITKATTLRGLRPDVPITSCTECHNKDGLRLDVSRELEAIDKNRDFVCSYCHTSDVGRLDPPATHYLIAGREAMKRKDVK